MNPTALLVLAGIIPFALLGSVPANQASPPVPLVELDWETLRNALIWVDGVPLLPPYTVEIVGDSAVVVNSVPVKTIPTRSWQRPPKTASELLHDRAYEAMFAAIGRGVPDSLIAAVGCSVFAAADTSLCLSAEVGPGGTSIVTRSRWHGELLETHKLVPSRATVEAKKRPKPSTIDRLSGVHRGIEAIIATRDFGFVNDNDAHRATVPRSMEQPLFRDIIAAASQQPFDKKKWQQDSIGGPHVLDWVSARKISEHATWTGR